MKLKFALKKQQLEHLCKIIQLAYQIWSQQKESIRLYFDTDQLIIYSEQVAGFDMVHARIHIRNDIASGSNFFSVYSVKSQKEKCHMVMKLDISTLIDDLKVLVDLCQDVQFKLAQDSQGHKYFDVIGLSQDKNITTTKITIQSFEKDGPEELPKQEVEFQLDQATCSFVMGKFHQRINIIDDKSINILFQNDQKNDNLYENGFQDQPNQNQEGERGQLYQLLLKSDHMTANVTSRQYQANFTDYSNMKEQYLVSFTKDVFNKFFHCLKVPGSAIMRISDEQQIEMDYTLEKCQHITIVLFAQSKKERF